MRIYVTINVFKEYEYVDIISLSDLGGKFVIVGVTAEGIANQSFKRQYVPTAYTSTHATEFYRWIQTYSGTSYRL